MDSIGKLGQQISGLMKGGEVSQSSSVDKSSQVTNESGVPDSNALDKIGSALGKAGKVIKPIVKEGAPLVGDLCKCMYGTVEPWVAAGAKLVFDALVEVCKVVISEVCNLVAGEVVGAAEAAIVPD